MDWKGGGAMQYGVINCKGQPSSSLNFCDCDFRTDRSCETTSASTKCTCKPHQFRLMPGAAGHRFIALARFWASR